MDLNRLTIKKVHKSFKKNDFSVTELTKRYLKRISKLDKKIKAYVTVCSKEALKEAKEKDKQLKKVDFSKKPLFGIPMAIKDNFCTKGIKTTASSKILENYVPVYEATVVKKLKEAGAIILGKTNMDAWAHGSSTEVSDFFTTCNPWNLERLPGGSSGGSAAAVVASMALAGIGSETAGSVRQPASWCGAVGIKPSYGRVSRYGLISMCSSTDCPGPITKTVEDGAIILKVIAGKDKLDATSLKSKVDDYTDLKIGNLKKIRLGVVENYFFKKMEEDVKKGVNRAILLLEKKGVRVEKVKLLDPSYSLAVYTIIQRAEVSSNLARYDGIRFGRKRSYFGQEAKRRIMLGTYVLSRGYYDQYYLKAQKARTLICQDFEKVFKKVDLLVAPTSPTVALEKGASKNKAMFGEIADILVEASSLAGLCGISVNCGFSKENMPIGIQFMGPILSEKKMLRIANFYQRETKWWERAPNLE